MAVLAPLLTTADPITIDIKNRFAGPSLQHLFGTDHFGRDVYTRVLYGSRISLQVAVVSVVFALAVGVPLGAIAAYAGGAVDNIVMRAMDALLAFPSIMLALLLRFVLGPSITSVMLAIAIIRVPVLARTVRGSVLAEREKDYVTAARAVGQTGFRILFRHILPNVLGPLMVLATVFFGNAILIEAGMSFLGIGTPPPNPSWGGMLNDTRPYIELHPYLALAPGLAIFLAVLGINLFGDALRDALDPRLVYKH